MSCWLPLDGRYQFNHVIEISFTILVSFVVDGRLVFDLDAVAPPSGRVSHLFG